MEPDQDEEKLLRSAALQNAQSIFIARRRAEEALERKTQELALSLSMVRATFEATTDAIAVTDERGKLTDYNAKFAQMWRISLENPPVEPRLDIILPQLADPASFRATLKEIAGAAPAPPESFTIVECTDGRVLECHSNVRRVAERTVGRVWSFRDVTARQRAEGELREQREWFRVTLASIGDAVITTDTDARVTFLNPVAEAMTGWTTGAARGQPLALVFNIINEETRKPAANPITRVLREGVIVGLANHTALIAKDGTEIAIEDSAAPIRDSAGKINGAVMVFHDVTEQRKAENALRRNEQLLSDFFENAAVGLHWENEDGKILRANHTELKMLGYSEAEYVGHHIAEFHADALAISDILGRLKRRENLENYAARLRCKDGSFKEVLVSSNVLLEGGKFVHTRCFTRDITEYKRAEQARGHLAAIVESSIDAIVSKDLNGIITSWNDGAQSVFGYEAGEVIGKSVNLLIPEERRNEESEILARIRRGERVANFETVRRSKTGILFDVSLTVSPIKNAKGEIVGASKIARDITHQKSIEREIKQARDEAVAASRAKDDFLAALSHELRTPLNPVLLIATDAAMDPNLPASIRADFDTIAKNVALEARLIDDLLDITRITNGKLVLDRAMHDVREILREAIATVRGEFEEKHLEFTVPTGGNPIQVFADEARLMQVFWNVLKNAAKFTPEGGRVTVAVLQSSDNSQLTVRITDSGIGMTREELARLFVAFSQGEHASTRSAHRFGGLGLGLAISRTLVEMHGGKIGATSAGRGTGSTFWIDLPLAE